jgi:hypothetical protein
MKFDRQRRRLFVRAFASVLAPALLGVGTFGSCGITKCARADEAVLSSEEADTVRPVTEEERADWRHKFGPPPSRLRIERLSHGGWTLVRPDGSRFQAIGIEYEPLALYRHLDWNSIAKDLDLIRDAGFNTVTVWCMNFNKRDGRTRRLTMKEMTRLADLADQRGLYMQFYILADRFTDRFPYAVLPDERRHHFDIDYADPDFRAFLRSYAQRLAMALYARTNVSTIVIWEEKIGLDYAEHGDRVSVVALYGSDAGKAQFGHWLMKRHGTLADLNRAWGTRYKTLKEAVDRTLVEYQQGVPANDHRQFDVLEFGTVLLADFAREFVAAYREIDPGMLFECRHFDLFGPQRALHPAYSFLDSFGVNQYSIGNKGADISFREEVVKVKLAAGIVGKAVSVGNFGFRTASWDGGTHGLVPDDATKAQIAADTVALFNWIPEIVGSSYFTYYYSGWEGPWGIVDAPGGQPLPIYHALRAAHRLLKEKNDYVAASDYAESPRVHIFNGLDAIFLLQPRTWIEHTTFSYDLTEMNVNYDVVSDNNLPVPRPGDVLIANFGAYDRLLDTNVAARLYEYAMKGGTLVIGNGFATHDRYLWPNAPLRAMARNLRGGFEVSDVKTGTIELLLPNDVTLTLENSFYVLAPETYSAPADSEVLLWMKAEGRRQPGLIRQPAGQGQVLYFLFNPYFQSWYGDNLDKINRASLPIWARVFAALDVPHDRQWGQRGFSLVQGRVNIHERPVHYFVSKDAEKVGASYADEYGDGNQSWSGGVLANEYLSFRGQRLQEGKWAIETPACTSLGACVTPAGLLYFTSDPVLLHVRAHGFDLVKPTEPYRVYVVENPPTSP